MAGEPTIILRGNLGRDPEKSDRADVVNVSVAVTPRVKRNGEWADGEPIWHDVSLWGPLGDNFLDEGFRKGDAVLIIGAIRGTRAWSNDRGGSGILIQVAAEQAGRWIPTWANRNSGQRQQEQRDDYGWPAEQPASAAATYNDETPF